MLSRRAHDQIRGDLTHQSRAETRTRFPCFVAEYP